MASRGEKISAWYQSEAGLAHREKERQKKLGNSFGRKHGHSPKSGKSPEYSSYGAMISRCYNPNDPKFQQYGGRGITICDLWRFGDDTKTGFECFLEDVGERPLPKRIYSVDRIKNDRPYEPGNVKWSTRKEQAQNRRNPSLTLEIKRSRAEKTAKWRQTPEGIAYLEDLRERNRRRGKKENAP
jgi:hypothetical protein